MKDYMDKFLVDVPDFPKKGIIFRDIAPLLENGEAFGLTIRDMVEIIRSVGEKAGGKVDKIICADARGFLFGAAAAVMYGCGLVIARKPGKLPRPGFSEKYALEYGENELVVSENSISKGEKVIIMDDIIATGGSAAAMERLVKDQGGIPIAAVFFSELVALEGYKQLDCPVYALVSFGCSVGDTVIICDKTKDNNEIKGIVTAITDKGIKCLIGSNDGSATEKEILFENVKYRVVKGEKIEFHL